MAKEGRKIPRNDNLLFSEDDIDHGDQKGVRKDLKNSWDKHHNNSNDKEFLMAFQKPDQFKIVFHG